DRADSFVLHSGEANTGDDERALRPVRDADAGGRARGGGEIPGGEGPHDCHADRPRGCEMNGKMSLWGSLLSCGRLSIGQLPRSQGTGGGNQPPRRLPTCPTLMAHFAWLLILVSCAA